MATTQQQFCVRWNSYQSNLQNAFPKLLTSEHFVDVTLACESEMIKCHKVVLSACSTYFEKLLVQNPCQHPIIFMKDMRFAEMQALVDFMYKGEVNVTQDELPSLLRSAEALQIRGLCGSDQLLSQHYLGVLQNNQAQANQQSKTPTVNGDDTNREAAAPPAASTPLNSATTPAAAQLSATTSPFTEASKANLTSCNTTITESPPHENGTISSSALPMSVVKRENSFDGGSGDECDLKIKDEYNDNDDSYYDNDGDLMDTDYLDQDDDDLNQPGTSGGGGGIKSEKNPDYAIANVSCQYSDGSPGGGIPGARRIRRSEAELRRAAECITRGQTFQTVSDQFNIPISTIRFYMARKGILPRRKRGRACSTASPGGMMSQGSSSLGNSPGYHGASGNTSPIGPPYHIVHYKLPALGAKLK